MPVLPADFMPSRMARRAVPSSTTLLIMKAMSEATCRGIARVGFLPSRSKRQIVSPAPERTSRIAWGVTAMPLFGKVA